MNKRRTSSKGFSLVETLVALAIAGVTLSGFYQSLSTGSFLSKRSNKQATKVHAAVTVMDRVGIDLPLRIGTQENGQIGTFAWTLQIGETPPPDMRLGTIYDGELLFVSVSIIDTAAPDAAPVVLRSIRYAGDAL